ncbi:MAG: low-specificity L-threonine aldolase [Dehalococcoidia bacterium]|jgi:threonine aldolase|nr:low-specificity L-threonine aldolase [Dehalococcoidia bacterium]|tara:strand:+ start:5726 stop:6760 length:1035 start_codon:yes stop_codon:yes gene_type:complete
MNKIIDLRSDTVSLPTDEMREAIYRAELGDDVYGEDPTVNALEAKAAQIFGMESAVLVASGTMGNLVASLAQCQRGDEVIVGNKSHLLLYEVANLAVTGGIQIRPIENKDDGTFDLNELELVIRGDDIHVPRTKMVVIENTHNRCSGAVIGLDHIKEISKLARSRDMKVHIDGARIFNAALALGVTPDKLVENADTITFCLSKGLSCPIGSIVCGSKETILEVRRNRKMLGGGMRQAGIFAAAGVVALDTMVDRMSEDHNNAKTLAQGIAEIDGLQVEPNMIKTNIVIVEVLAKPITKFISDLKEKGLLVSHADTNRVRLVTHYGIEESDISKTLEIVDSAISN